MQISLNGHNKEVSFLSENLAKINNKWIRLAVLIIVFINTAAMLLGYKLIPLSNEELASVLSLIA